MKPILEIEKLDAGYNSLKVLEDVDMFLDKKEIVAIIGPNGAGKSTVIKAIFGIANQTGGKIVLNGKDISTLKTHELIKEGVCYVNQGRVIFGDLSVKENLEIGTRLEKDKKELNKRLEEVYQRFPILKERAKESAYTLSGGQQQMLALGRALMQKPKVLLLDEPSLGLSPKLQKEIFQIIKDLRDEGISIMIVEQNAKKAIEIADRTYLLENGKVALVGKGKDLLRNKKIKQIYLGGA
ncbi:putative branched-chain amino acid transport ATP-binding protein LivG [uncultured archaeon]|nr:putative branched-chain amino acid transport ATP-binding protein LivG [uncultured archaeon]